MRSNYHIGDKITLKESGRDYDGSLFKNVKKYTIVGIYRFFVLLEDEVGIKKCINYFDMAA